MITLCVITYLILLYFTLKDYRKFSEMKKYELQKEFKMDMATMLFLMTHGVGAFITFIYLCVKYLP